MPASRPIRHTDFNPRSREGSDLRNLRMMILSTNFNPRSREGSDQLRVPFRQQVLISIHAPVKGATRHLQQIPMSLSISIHAPVKGATLVRMAYTWHQSYFNPRSREGSDSTMIHPMTNI